MMRYTPKTNPVPPPCGRDCPGRAPGCSAMCCSWMLYQSIREHIYQKQLAEKHAQELNFVAQREKVPQWISVEERSPEPGKRVLATDGVFVGEAYRTSADTWRRYDGIAMRDCLGSIVTHWMPLPEAQEAHNGKENS